MIELTEVRSHHGVIIGLLESSIRIDCLFQAVKPIDPHTSHRQYHDPGYFGFIFVQWEEVEVCCPDIDSVMARDTNGQGWQGRNSILISKQNLQAPFIRVCLCVCMYVFPHLLSTDWLKYNPSYVCVTSLHRDNTKHLWQHVTAAVNWLESRNQILVF